MIYERGEKITDRKVINRMMTEFQSNFAKEETTGSLINQGSKERENDRGTGA